MGEDAAPGPAHPGRMVVVGGWVLRFLQRRFSCPLIAEYALLFLWWGWVVGVSDRRELYPSGWLFSRVE